MNIEANGNLQIIAYEYINNLTKSDMRYFLTIDQNGRIIEKVELNGINGIADAFLAHNKIMATDDNKLKIFE